MYNDNPVRLSSPLIQAVEDAILFGHIQEIDGVLELAREDMRLPEPLRYGLESLMYFRQYYGKGGALEPVASAVRQRMAQMENSWGRELIESIGHYPDLTEMKYA